MRAQPNWSKVGSWPARSWVKIKQALCCRSMIDLSGAKSSSRADVLRCYRGLAAQHTLGNVSLFTMFVHNFCAPWPPPPNQQNDGFPLEFLLKGPQTELQTLSQNCEQTLQKLRTNRIIRRFFAPPSMRNGRSQFLAISMGFCPRFLSIFNRFWSMFCRFQSVSVSFSQFWSVLISFNQFDSDRNAGIYWQPEGGENTT